jgi:hypothetical protein
MRSRILFAIALCGLLGCLQARADATAPWGQYAIAAGKVTFYGRYVLTADDNVTVRLPDGGTITGDAFSMDLRLNRFVIAGHVEVKDKGVDLRAAAVARFFMPIERTYLIPVSPEPDRWTFEDESFTHPLRGREMPGDTFFFTDVSREPPFIVGKRALLVPSESIKITPATVVLGSAHIPSPGYFINLSSNVNYAQNSLAAAEFDGPYPFAGGNHSRSTLHIRYDPLNKLYASYEQAFFVTDSGYVTASINPMTRPQRQYNLIQDDRFAPKAEERIFFQESAFQSWLKQPLSAGALVTGQLTLALPRSYLQFNQDFFYGSLLAMPRPIDGQYYYGDSSHNWYPGHPSDGTVSWIGRDTQIGKVRWLTYRLRSGWGYAHDPVIDEGTEYVPPPALGGVNYTTLYHDYVGATLTTASFKLIRDRMGIGRDLYFNAYADFQRQWFSMPHVTDNLTIAGSLSKQLTPKLSSYVTYSIQQINDNYGSQQLLAYAPNAPYSPVTNQTYPGYEAFIGFATVRSLTEGIVFTPTEYFQASITARENHDFPVPIPGPIAPLVGFTPYQITPQVRFRLLPNLQIILSRSYYFHFGIQNWDPQFTFQITK